jgi:AbrB family looped-hinge helix DNA binding protein
MDSELATLTSKGQVTVPKTVRDALGLRQGAHLAVGSGGRRGGKSAGMEQPCG